MNNIRQKKIGELIRKELSILFQRNGTNTHGGGMVTITNVDVTPDLLIARVYLSLFKINDVEKFLEGLNNNMHELRGHLGKEIRHQVRHIPELDFKLDDTLDSVFRLEELFKKNKQ
ncbi:MAG: 30S ribosome-binding factor RbfA [Bacteroidota bacterium]